MNMHRFRAGALVLACAVAVLGGGLLLPQSRTDAQTLTADERARLQAEYDQLQQEIAQWQKVLDDTRKKKSSLQGDVTALNAQIKKAESEIRQRNVTITSLGSEIREKTKNISALEARLEDGRESLSKLLRAKAELEQTPLAVVALTSDSLSTFFNETNAIDSVNRELQRHFDEVRNVKDATQKEKQALDERKNRELDAKYEVEVKKKEISRNESEKKQLLAVTASEEKSYQQVLAERQRRAETIRSALFELRDSQGIPFSTALEYATAAQRSTGVRAAFILGILRQESNLGVNVGQCLLTDPETGAGKGKNTGTPFKNVMKPDRDVEPFLDLMSRLGRSPYGTPVSCPQSIGYGGAMGPSQFIASTWRSYEKRLAAALGVPTADPWNAKHAVMATALYLADLGADRGGYSAEREAAARYYAGGSWKTNGLGYAASVLSFAEKYQEDIDFLDSL